jgi:hypothetical protein
MFLSEFIANKPKYFILIKDKLLGPCYFRYTDAPTAFFQFDAVKQIIRSEYHLEQDPEDYTVFRRNGQVPVVARAATAPSGCAGSQGSNSTRQAR